MKLQKPVLGSILQSFFEDYLKTQRALSITTVRSYRDVLKLFIVYVANTSHRKITRLSLLDLTSDRVLSFLEYLELERHNHIRSRNHRLSVLKVFFEYLATKDPDLLAEAERVAAIPTKRVAPAETVYMIPDQIDVMFSKLPTKGRFALRDRTLLLFLYNTGSRVQEAADLRVENLEMGSRRLVHLHGKGDKWRVCPLWEETVSLLTQLIGTQKSVNSSSPVFMSMYHRPLTRFGIYKIVRRHTQHVSMRSTKKISPHSFRHSTAVHLLESGVDVNVIRAWLGHVSLVTTNHYAEISAKMKVKAVKTCEPPPSITKEPREKYRWRDDSSLLKWLESL